MIDKTNSSTSYTKVVEFALKVRLSDQDLPSDQELEKVLDYVLVLEALPEPAPAEVGPRKQALFELLQAQQAV